jgi:localization factor PodJL
MRRHALSRLDSLDLDARALATAAARRAGLSLEEWAAAVLGEGGPGLEQQRYAPAPPRRRTGSDLDNLIARMSGPPLQKPKGDYEALMAAVAAESERQAQDQASRTAVALESMASWIEQAEIRLSETARASADQQDRIAALLSGALSSLKDRLDTVERQVASERAAPPRMEFPVEEALKALAPVSETLTGLRQDMSRLATRLEQPDPAWTPAVSGIRADIDGLRSSLEGLATREEIAALDAALGTIARDLEQGHAGKDLRTLASSIAALYRQVQSLTDEVSDGLHGRVVGEIDLIKSRIDRMAETGIDRSVIDFLSSQIVDMRQDLAHRAEPQQIARLSETLGDLGRQVAELRLNQVGKGDFAALKTSLDHVCSALSATAAAQEAGTVSEQLESLGRRLDVLARRPEPQPADLDPITEQLTLLTEHMAGISGSLPERSDALSGMMERLSAQMQAAAEREAPSQETLQETLIDRFERIERELQQLGQRTDTAGMAQVLHAIGEKLDRQPAQPAALDKAFDEAAGHLKNLQSETAGIAERAARAALSEIRPSLPDSGDLDAIKQGFVELKALHSRTDKKTQDTLRNVHEALEALVSRLPGQAPSAADPMIKAEAGLSQEPQSAADRLEAAVRRLHAATLSHIEDASLSQASPAPSTGSAAAISAAALSPPQEPGLGLVRASFIAAARRAARTASPETAAPQSGSPLKQEASRAIEAAEPGSREAAPASSSLFERLRKTFDGNRRPLLFGIAFLMLAAGTARNMSIGEAPPAPAHETAKVVEAKPIEAASIPDAGKTASLLEASSLTAEPVWSAPPAAGKFIVDPGTVGSIPAGTPAALRQAALSGDATALYEIAAQAAEGRGMVQDMATAAHFFERAAQAGLPPAQERLAMLHERGAGVPRDLKQAAFWYERAALGGNIRAMHNLATLLVSGATGKPDHPAALRWYGEAAEAGFRDSQFNMGLLLARGIGSKPDLPRAFHWFSLAAAQGDAEAVRKRDEVAGRLGAADLKAAKSALEQWRPRTIDAVANEPPAAARGQTAALDRTSGNKS